MKRIERPRKNTYLVALAEELLGVLELEVVVVLVGLRSESDFLHLNLHLLGLHLLGVLLLLIEEFAVVNETTNRGLGIG